MITLAERLLSNWPRMDLSNVAKSLSAPKPDADFGRVIFIRTDVTSWESQVTAFKSAIKFGGHDSVDVVCAVAGVPGAPFIMPNEEPASLEKDPPKPPMVEAVYDVNAKGVYFTSKLAQHYFGLANGAQQQFKKVLIMISSLAGYFEFNDAEYCSSKWVGFLSLVFVFFCLISPSFFRIICHEQVASVWSLSSPAKRSRRPPQTRF